VLPDAFHVLVEDLAQQEVCILRRGSHVAQHDVTAVGSHSIALQHRDVGAYVLASTMSLSILERLCMSSHITLPVQSKFIMNIHARFIERNDDQWRQITCIDKTLEMTVEAPTDALESMLHQPLHVSVICIHK